MKDKEAGGPEPSAEDLAPEGIAATSVDPRTHESTETNRGPTQNLDGASRALNEIKSSIRLLDFQLKHTVPQGYGADTDAAFRREAVGLYARLAPKGPVESILARLIVGASNTAMDCFNRAGSTRQEPAHSLNVQSALKSTVLAADLLEQLEAHQWRRTRDLADGTIKPSAQPIGIQSSSRPRRSARQSLTVRKRTKVA